MDIIGKSQIAIKLAEELGVKKGYIAVNSDYKGIILENPYPYINSYSNILIFECEEKNGKYYAKLMN
jgi:hypothetical protein